MVINPCALENLVCLAARKIEKVFDVLRLALRTGSGHKASQRTQSLGVDKGSKLLASSRRLKQLFCQC